MYEEKDTIKEPILKVYLLGSRLYNIHHKDSDFDFIVVVDSEDENLMYDVKKERSDYHIYSEKAFIKKIKEHDIQVLEAIFSEYDLNKYMSYFELDKELLRKQISAVSSNSFVKCKKKMLQGDEYIGKKSMYHSIRILGYGIQIAKYGRIVNYEAYNFYYDIVMCKYDWEEIHECFKPIYNSMKSEFKILAPIDKDFKK